MFANPVNAGLYPVAVVMPSGLAKQQVLAKLEEMQRELNHIQTAVTDMARAIRSNDQRSLVSGVMNSRNWLFSIAESHAFVQTAVHSNEGSGASTPGVQLDMLFARSVKLGISRGNMYKRK